LRNHRCFFGSLLLVVLTACGGGGSGGGGGGGTSTSVALTPTSLNITAVEGDVPPAASIVHASFSGAALIVGYAPGVTPPNWLTVAQDGTGTATSADFALAVTDTLTVGTRSVPVRFATGTAAGADLTYADLPVTYTITASDLAISASPTALTFSANTTGPLPAAQNLVLTFNGNPPTVTGVPSWLTVTPPANSTANSATYAVSVNSSSFPGAASQSADLVFTTTRAGSTLLRTATVHVVLNVTQPFDVTSAGSTLAFTGITKSTQPPQPTAGYGLGVVGTQAAWSVSANQPWIKVSPTSGTNAGMVMVTATNTGLGHGTFTGTVTVTDSISMTSRTFMVTLLNSAANLKTNPSLLNFNIDLSTAASALSQPVVISDDLMSAQPSEAVSWALQPGTAAWLQWTPASGTSVPARTATASLNLTELAKLIPGDYSTTVTLAAVNAAGIPQTVTIPVTLTYEPAYVTFIGPYVGIANTTGTFIARGVNFTPATPAPVTVTVGSTQITGITPDGDGQITVAYPALSAGTYPVAVKNAAGITASNASLVILNPVAYAYQAINAPSTRSALAYDTRLIYDAERQTLYGVDRIDQQIEKYALTAGAWSAGTPYVLPQLTDLALSPDGRLLLALTQNAVSDIPLTGTPFTATPRASNPTAFCGQFLDSLSVTNDGLALVNSKLSGCSGFTQVYQYDERAYTLSTTQIASLILYNGTLAVGADGSKVYTGSNGVSPAQPIITYSAFGHTLSTAQSVTYNLNAATVSGNASRVILQGTDVYTGALTIAGNLPATAGTTLASRDSTRAYVYSDDPAGGGPRLAVYNLNGALQTGALYPLLKTVTLADAANASSGEYGIITMAETPDGNTVFISGNAKLLVVPVN
jgi:hypothetical protein